MMKFTMPFEGEYDQARRELTISGRTTAGNKTSVTIPISAPEEFLVWAAHCFGEQSVKDGNAGTILTATRISFSMHPVSEGLDALVLRTEIGGMPLSFALPARNLTPEQHRSIAERMQVALAILEQADSGAPSN